MLRMLVAWLGCSTLLAFTACTAHVFSPPAQSAPGEVAATTPVDTHSLRLTGLTYDAITGLAATGFDLRYSYGLLEELDLQAALSLLRFTESSSADTHANLYTGRIGVRYAPAFFDDHIALTSNIGGGASAGGGFLSPDLGLTLALDNPYLVPFAQGTLFLSIPIAPEAVDISPINTPAGHLIQTPRLTYGWHAAVGVKLYIGNRANPIHGAFSLAATVTHLADDQANTTILGISPGMELAF